MKIQFATCERHRALGFLKQFYPSRNLEDFGVTKELLDIVQADIIRIPDPKFHPEGHIFPSTNWDESKREVYIDILTRFAGE